jgi:hypothetical protein
MATLTPQAISIAGLTPSFSAASAGGDKLPPGTHIFLRVKNGGASAVTVTVAANPTASGLTVTSPTVSVAAAGDVLIGPFPSNDFAAAADGLVAVSYSAVTSVTVAALRT